MRANVVEQVDVMLKTAQRLHAPVFDLVSLKLEPWQRLISIMLSSRTRDEATIKATKRLFSKYPTIDALASAPVGEVESLIRGVGFYRVKAANVVKIAQGLMHDKGYLDDPEKIMELPGVGEKVRNVFFSRYGMGIGVDVHVHRISNRLGWVHTTTPHETEEALRALFPRQWFPKVNLACVGFGQVMCRAKPLCHHCPLSKHCIHYTNHKP